MAAVYLPPPTAAATLPTYKDLDLHTQQGHPKMQKQAAPVQAGGGTGGGMKPDKLPRPQIGEGASQSDWMNFKSGWDGDAYKARISVVTSDVTNKKQLVDDTSVYNTNPMGRSQDNEETAGSFAVWGLMYENPSLLLMYNNPNLPKVSLAPHTACMSLTSLCPATARTSPLCPTIARTPPSCQAMPRTSPRGSPTLRCPQPLCNPR
jgi:hypothetical protein